MTNQEEITKRFGLNLRGKNHKYEKEFQKMYKYLMKELFLDPSDAFDIAEYELAHAFMWEELG